MTAEPTEHVSPPPNLPASGRTDEGTAGGRSSSVVSTAERQTAASTSDRPLTVLFAPDSFKGSLSSVEVARALAAGWSRARPDDRLELSPLGDGGEGTLEAIAAAGGWEWQTTSVMGPQFATVEARWLASNDWSRAVLEMAQASGLSLIPVADRDTQLATSFGTGQLLLAALDLGIRSVALGIGGSATTDGGSGILEALGASLIDEDGQPLIESPTADFPERTPAIPALLGGVERVDLDGLDRRLLELDLRVASDVTNPLLGSEGAAAVYGPQKGATDAVIEFLDDNLRVWSDALEAATGRHERETPGAGAAGGVGFALLCLQDRFRSFALRPGVELVMEATGFEAKLAAADLVVTGEGRIDAQTAFGKTAAGVAERARRAVRPCIAVGGGVEATGIEALGRFGAVVVPVVERPQSVEEAMAAGTAPLERCGERIARLVSIGRMKS